jgi:hypothetical protein
MCKLKLDPFRTTENEASLLLSTEEIFYLEISYIISKMANNPS